MPIVHGVAYSERYENPGSRLLAAVEYVGDVIQANSPRLGGRVLIPEHVHSYYEFSLVTEGNVRYLANGVIHSLSVGDLAITRPGDLHLMECPVGDQWRMLYVAVSNLGADFLDRAIGESDTILLSDCSDLAPHLQAILAEARDRRLGYRDMLSIMTCEWLYAVARRIGGRDPSEETQGPSMTVRTARHAVERLCHPSLTVDQVAKETGISSSYLAHIFTKEMGITLHTYIRNMLMQRAERMLEDRRLSITEISAELGFDTIHGFSAAFKRHYGYSPSAYRKQKTPR